MSEYRKIDEWKEKGITEKLTVCFSHIHNREDDMSSVRTTCTDINQNTLKYSIIFSLARDGFGAINGYNLRSKYPYC